MSITILFLYSLNQFITSRLFFHQKKLEDCPVGEENKISSILTSTDMLFQNDDKHFMPADGLVKLNGKLSFEDFKSIVIKDFAFAKDTNGCLLYPKLTQVVKERTLFSTWEYSPNFNIENHVIEKLLDLSVSGELQSFLNAQHSVRLPRDIPGFQFFLIHDKNTREPTEQSETYIFYRFDHTMGDGLSFVRILVNSLAKPAPDEDKSKLSEMFKKYSKSQYELSIGRLFLLFLMLPIYFADFAELEPKNYLRRRATGKKNLTHSPALDFNKVAAIKKRTNTTVNDVMLMLVGQAFQAYMLEMGESPVNFTWISLLQAFTLKASLYEPMSNKVVAIRVKIPLQILDWREQLKEINAEMLVIKNSLYPPFNNFAVAGLGYFPKWVRKYSQPLILNHLTTGGFTNIPGPDIAMTLGGVPIEQLAIFMPQFADISIGCGFMTFNKKLTVSITTDQALCTNPDLIMNHFIRKLDEIYKKVLETPL